MSLQVSKVLISDKIDPCCKEIFEKNSIAVDYKPGLSKEELKGIISVSSVTCIAKIMLLSQSVNFNWNNFCKIKFHKQKNIFNLNEHFGEFYVE